MHLGKIGGRRSILYDFSRIDSRDIYSKKKEFLSEDAINVSTKRELEDATKCCNPVNPAPKQSKSPKAQDDVG